MPSTIPTRLVWAKISTAQPITAATTQSALIGAFSLSADAVASRVHVSRPPTTSAPRLSRVDSSRWDATGPEALPPSHQDQHNDDCDRHHDDDNRNTHGESKHHVRPPGRRPPAPESNDRVAILSRIGGSLATMLATCAQVGARWVFARRGIRGRSTQRAALQNRQRVPPQARGWERPWLRSCPPRL